MSPQNPSRPDDSPTEARLHAIVCCDAFTFQTGREPEPSHCYWCQTTRELDAITVLTTTYDPSQPEGHIQAKTELRERYHADTTTPGERAGTNPECSVLICGCGGAWIQQDVHGVKEVSCPSCGKRRPPISDGHGTSFKRKTFQDRSQAVDWRSKFLADAAGWTDIYENHTATFVQTGSGTGTDYGDGGLSLEEQHAYVERRLEEDAYLVDERSLEFARSVFSDPYDICEDLLSGNSAREKYAAWADAVAGTVGDDVEKPLPTVGWVVPVDDFSTQSTDGSPGFAASSQFTLSPTTRVTEAQFSAESDASKLWKPSRFLSELVSHEFFRAYLGAAHDLTKGLRKDAAIEKLVEAGVTPFDTDPEDGRDDAFATLIVDALFECHAAANGEVEHEAYPDPGDEVAFGEVLPGVNRPVRKDPDWWTPATFTLHRSLQKLLYSNPLNPERDGIERVRAALRVFPESTVTPGIEVGIGDGFHNNTSKPQRDAVLEMLNALAEGCAVGIATTRLGARKLHRNHKGSIPRRVTEALNPSISTLPSDSKAKIRTARERIKHGSALDRIMRLLADETEETLAYDAIEHRLGYSNAYVRKLASRLRDLELVDSVTDHRDKRVVVLTPLGRKYLQAIPHQETFSHYNSPDSSPSGGASGGGLGGVTDPGTSSEDSRGTPTRHDGATQPADPTTEDHDPDQNPGEHGARGPRAGDVGGELAVAEATTRERQGRSGYIQVETLGLRDAVAVRNATQPGEFRLLDRETSFFQKRGEDDSRIPTARYLPEQQAYVVSVAPKNPLELQVGFARALASQKTFTRVLTPAVLEEAVEELPPILLQQARNIGLSTDRLEHPEDIPGFFLEWEASLCNLLSIYREAKDDDAGRARINSLRGVIMRTAKGLAGSIVHLLALTDVEYVRELRIPHATRDWGTPTPGADSEKDFRRRALLESLAKQAAIESQYGQFVPYRALYEQDAEKRNGSIMPNVDHTNPYGEYIGATLISGPGVSDWQHELEDALSNPAPVHEDAPNLNVRHRIRTTASRRHIAQAMQDVLATKNLTLTREATALFTALVGNEYATVQALFDGLASEPPGVDRDVQPVELRKALTELSPRELLPDQSGRALQETLHALLRASEWLSTSDLCERAGISTKTFRESVRDHLQQAGLLAGDGHGWRLTLNFDTERRTTGPFHLPWPFHPNPIGHDLPDLPRRLPQDILWAAIRELPASPERYGTPGDPLTEILEHPPPPDAIERLDREFPGFRLLARLAIPFGTGEEAEWTVSEVGMGPRLIEQHRLSSSTHVTAD